MSWGEYSQTRKTLGTPGGKETLPQARGRRELAPSPKHRGLEWVGLGFLSPRLFVFWRKCLCHGKLSWNLKVGIWYLNPSPICW